MNQRTELTFALAILAMSGCEPESPPAAPVLLPETPPPTPIIEGVPSPASCAAAAVVSRTAVLLVQMGDSTLSCSHEAVASTFFDPNVGTAAFYLQASHGLLDVQGDVLGPFAIPADDTCIGPSDAPGATAALQRWHQQVDAAAAAAGIDLSAYERLVYALPQRPACMDRGGVSRPTWQRAFVFQCDSPALFAHEYGHLLGMNHASTPEKEYGDDSDFMGSGKELGLLSAPHRAAMGWLPPEQVIDVRTSGLYRVRALELDSSAVRVLVIPRSDDPTKALYVSLPTELGGRTSVHEFSATCPPKPQPKSMLWARLGDGESHTTGTVRITQVAHAGDAATLEIVVEAR